MEERVTIIILQAMSPYCMASASKSDLLKVNYLVISIEELKRIPPLAEYSQSSQLTILFVPPQNIICIIVQLRRGKYTLS